MDSIMTVAAAVFAVSLGALVFSAYHGWNLPNLVEQLLAGGVVIGASTCLLIGYATGRG